MSHTDRVVFVAGATGVLGRVVAAAFAEQGHRVALGGRDPERLRSVAGELGLSKDGWVAATGDLRTAAGAVEAATTAIAAFGRIDILVHLVGGFAAGTPLVELERAETEAMLDQHVWTTLNIVKAVVPAMMDRGWGRVIAAGTAAAITAPAKSGPYAASKAAQEILLRTLAKEVAPSGVTVNIVAMRAIDERRERETAPTPKNAPWTTPEEIAATVLFLASDAAAAINGARIALDGRV
ncbi:MAG TPA: SDR family oxidoreductase [Verrucomicrobiae bacterium]|nr:SDR family oxidoreductase [Verrucomicrobiae bacterium]